MIKIGYIIISTLWVLSSTYSEAKATAVTDPVIYFLLFSYGWSVCQNAVKEKPRQDKNSSVSDLIRRPVFLCCTHLPWILVRCSQLLDMLLKLMS